MITKLEWIRFTVAAEVAAVLQAEELAAQAAAALDRQVPVVPVLMG
jgi:hypothetical protein|tara:strand:- start:218 stop:355 length:138 start_codon:yes stop_codon:yes gene_type:complete